MEGDLVAGKSRDWSLCSKFDFRVVKDLSSLMNWTGVFIVPAGFDLSAREQEESLGSQWFAKIQLRGSSWPKNKSRIQMNSNVLMSKAVESITSQGAMEEGRRLN